MNSCRAPALAAIALLAACEAPERQSQISPANYFHQIDVEGYTVHGSQGPAPHLTIVRAVNSFGAAVPAGKHNFDVNGAPIEVRFDGLGYGTINHPVRGTFNIGGGVENARSHAFAVDWPAVDMFRAATAPVPDASRVHPVSTGVIAIRQDEVWWMSLDSAAGHPVLFADGPVLGLEPRHIDVDGVTDAIAWTEHTVFLLRGRPQGGMAWGGAVDAPGYTVGGADVGDLDLDNIPDVAVAWSSPDSTSLLDVLPGDGLWGFDPALSDPRNLPERPVALSVGDNSGEGKPQVTILGESGQWNRYINGAPYRYMPIGPNKPNSAQIPAGSRSESGADMNNDGGDELIYLEPLNPGSERQVLIFDLRSGRDTNGDGVIDVPGSGAIKWTPTSQAGAYTDLGDGDGDDQPDLFMHLETGIIRAVSHTAVADKYDATATLMRTPFHGPLVVHDFTRDGISDVFIAGPARWQWWAGRNAPRDPDLFWEPDQRAPTLGFFGLVGPWRLVELDSNPATNQVVMFQVGDGRVFMKIRTRLHGVAGSVDEGAVTLAQSASVPRDLAVCGNNAWVLVAGGLVRVDISDASQPSVAAQASTNATRVTCGVGPQGARGAVLDNGTIVLLDMSLGAVGSVAADAAVDLALGDIGAGPEVRFCTTTDCTIELLRYSTGAQAGFVVGDPTSLELRESSGTRPLLGRGAVHVADVDGDGLQDVLAADRALGVVSLIRSTNGDLAETEWLHTTLDLPGEVQVGDGDGDGWNDLWFKDVDGNLKFIAPRVIEPDTTGTTDTGALDTGAP